MLLDPCKNADDAKYEAHLDARYGLWAGDYNDILIRQGKVCAVCGTDQPNTKNGRLIVDHCHDSGKIRGLLCQACNVAIGRLGDNISGVARALNYLLDSYGYTSLEDFAEQQKRVFKVSLYRRPGAKVFYMKCRRPDGKETRRTSRTTNRQKAAELAAAWEHQLNSAL